jgi:hypothetical protein
MLPLSTFHSNALQHHLLCCSSNMLLISASPSTCLKQTVKYKPSTPHMSLNCTDSCKGSLPLPSIG